MSRILITGGTGRLAHELKKHLEGDYVGIEDWDFIYGVPDPEYNCNLIIHMGAYTDVVKAEVEQQKCMATNVMGTFNLVQKYKHTPFIYISSEYCKDPLGVYALSKQLGEEIVKACDNYLILRTLFKPNPFPFEYAYEDQMTQGDSVDIVAKLLADIAKNWDGKTRDIQYLGTGRKSMLELARKTKPDVKPNKIKDYKYNWLIPSDYE